jgi:hypothetical protein
LSLPIKVTTLFLVALCVLLTLYPASLGLGDEARAPSAEDAPVAGLSSEARIASAPTTTPNRHTGGKVGALPVTLAQTSGRPGFVPAGVGDEIFQVGAPTRSGDDNGQMQRAIDDAIAALQQGKARSAAIRLQPNATYHLGSLPNFYDALKISTYDLPKRAVSDMSRQYANLVFDGRGATLSLSRTTSGIYMNGCKDCVVENFTLVINPDPMVGGIATAVDLANHTVDVALAAGVPFSLPADYDRATIVGKTKTGAVFRIPAADSFPDHYKFVSFAPHPHLTVASADPLSGDNEKFSFTAENAAILSRLPLGKATVSGWNPGLDRAKALYLWGPGGHALPPAIIAAASIRQRYPQYPWTFFTGIRISALYFEQNTDLTVRNITIYDFPGVGIHAQGNRGTLTFDRIRILAKSPSLLGAASDGMDLEGNQYGPKVTNSVFQNTFDDQLSLYSPAPFVSIGRVSGASVRLSYSFYALAAQTVLPGDRFRLLDSATGNSLGSYTVVSVAPLCVAKSQANAFNVTFDKILPTAADDPSTIFVDLDQVGSGADIEHNLFIGGERNGIVLSSSATIKNNLFVGLGLRAIGYNPFVPPIPGFVPHGAWGDFGPVDIAGNTAIDDWKFLEIPNLGHAGGYAVPAASIKLVGNAIYRPHSHAFDVANRYPLNIMASGNTIISSTKDPRQAIGDFLSMAGNAAAAPAGASLERFDQNALWNSECAAAKAWLHCSTGGEVSLSLR